MEIKVSANAPTKSTNSCAVVAIHSGSKLFGKALEIDKASKQAISRAIKRGDASSDVGKTLMLHELPNISNERILLVGAGQNGKTSTQNYRKLCREISITLHQNAAQTAIVYVVNDATSNENNIATRAQILAQALVEGAYQFDKHEQQEKRTSSVLKKCVFVVDKSELKNATNGCKMGASVARGMAVAKDLGNLAPNICTPSYLADQANAMGRKNPALKTRVLSEAQMSKLKMQAFLSVSRGSREPAKLICMEYKGAASSSKPIVLLGKGITFDTGGISIKSSAAMDEMKYDMCGAASVFGAMHAICELKLKCNVIGVVAAAENMPDGDASRPGDVVTSMSGQSIEILNTDAEGRLVLCDALTYVERYKPAAVIDIATLTGACVVALGNVNSAVMGNDQPLAEALIAAGKECNDKTWQLPLDEEYQAQLQSNFADIANIGGPGAGAITAGCFLSRFAKNMKWAHLDIAGVAWNKGATKGATGRPVPLLVQYVSEISSGSKPA